MNTTQTTADRILDNARELGSFKITQLAQATGLNETTVRKYVKANEWAFRATDTRGVFEYYVQPTPEAGEDAPRRRYRRHDTPTTRTTRTNQITKCEVAVLRSDEDEKLAKEHGIDTKWMTVCHTHNHAHGEDRVLDAHWYSSYPLFCAEVTALVAPAVSRRRKNKKNVPDSVADFLG